MKITLTFPDYDAMGQKFASLCNTVAENYPKEIRDIASCATEHWVMEALSQATSVRVEMDNPIAQVPKLNQTIIYNLMGQIVDIVQS